MIFNLRNHGAADIQFKFYTVTCPGATIATVPTYRRRVGVPFHRRISGETNGVTQ
jgi:hypothetical protein